MEDEKIVDLYWQRSEQAISETATKYGKYCKTISYNILANINDAEECVNDTYIKASKEDREKMDKNAYRLQSSVFFLFIFASNPYFILENVDVCSKGTS